MSRIDVFYHDSFKGEEKYIEGTKRKACEKQYIVILIGSHK